MTDISYFYIHVDKQSFNQSSFNEQLIGEMEILKHCSNVLLCHVNWNAFHIVTISQERWHQNIRLTADCDLDD